MILQEVSSKGCCCCAQDGDGKITAEGDLSVVFPAWVRAAKKPHGAVLTSLREQLFEPATVHVSQKLELPL